MVYEDLFSPGTELKELKFDNYLDWFIKVSDVRVHWKYQPSFIVSQASFILGGLCTLVHAFSRGGRFLHLWLACLIHGVAVESISYIAPDVDSFWHSQAPIMLLGRRFAFHIFFLYIVFYYHASVAVAKARLSRLGEACAVGLVALLVDIIYDVVTIRYMHWFWHDTDPNIFDRHYCVPWNSYYFHATFSAGLTFWFHFLKDKFCASEGPWISSKRCLRELITTILAGFLGAPTGILMFMPIYHPLHDNLKIHSEVTFFMLFSIFLVVVWVADRKPKYDDFTNALPHETHWSTFVLCFHLFIHYAVLSSILVIFKPENEVATGIKERIGPCDEYSSVRTVFGQILQKRKYLCPTNYDEKYYGWSCLPNGNPPSNGSLWYTACGVPFDTHEKAEYIIFACMISCLALVVFYNLHFKSFGDGVFTRKSKKNPGKIAAQKKKN